MSKYYIYQHIGNKSNKPFYVGMSTNVHGDFVRMKDSKNRTPEWEKVVKDEKGFTHFILVILLHNFICRYFHREERHPETYWDFLCTKW